MKDTVLVDFGSTKFHPVMGDYTGLVLPINTFLDMVERVYTGDFNELMDEDYKAIYLRGDGLIIIKKSQCRNGKNMKFFATPMNMRHLIGRHGSNLRDLEREIKRYTGKSIRARAEDTTELGIEYVKQ